MLQALIIGIAGLSAVGIFLAVRGIVRLFLEKETKLATLAIIFFVAVPLIFVLGLLLAESVLEEVWVFLPLILLLVVWVCFGFFLEAYLRKEKQRKLSNEKRVIPERPAHWLRNNLLIIAAGIMIWLFGAFVGFGQMKIVETCAICVALFLVVRGCAALWRYRGF